MTAAPDVREGDDGVIHISSIVVRALPAAVEDVSELISSIEGAELELTDAAGRMVIVLETPSLHDVTEAVDILGRHPEVLSAALVYHQIENAGLVDTPVETGIHSQAEVLP